MDAPRHLFVIADDFGIGPQTSRGILDLAARGLVTGTVLLVNSAHARSSVAAWRRCGEPVELGWHPCLTLDGPVSSPGSVPSLVRFDGRFWPLGAFLRRLFAGRIRVEDIRTELSAQYQRFCELVGHPPTLVNSHQHVALFSPVGDVLLELLKNAAWSTYIRAVREPWQTLRFVPGARIKRCLLSRYGQGPACRFEKAGFSSADWLAGLSTPRHTGRADYFTRWISNTPGRVIELMCHPGHLDPTLGGRDGTPEGSSQLWRTDEYRRIIDPAFADACEHAGFQRVRPAEWLGRRQREQIHAA